MYCSYKQNNFVSQIEQICIFLNIHNVLIWSVDVVQRDIQAGCSEYNLHCNEYGFCIQMCGLTLTLFF